MAEQKEMTFAEALELTMTAYNKGRELWISKFGTDEGFDAFFSDYFDGAKTSK